MLKYKFFSLLNVTSRSYTYWEKPIHNMLCSLPNMNFLCWKMTEILFQESTKLIGLWCKSLRYINLHKSHSIIPRYQNNTINDLNTTPTTKTYIFWFLETEWQQSIDLFAPSGYKILTNIGDTSQFTNRLYIHVAIAAYLICVSSAREDDRYS